MTLPSFRASYGRVIVPFRSLGTSLLHHQFEAFLRRVAVLAVHEDAEDLLQQAHGAR